jgi:archaeosine synthase beta-subunit
VSYPQPTVERTRWILRQRGAKAAVDPWKPAGFFAEDERAESGEVVSVATILLTNRECPWRCLHCDLWQHTTDETVPPGAIPAQIDHALARLPVARQIKLYNAGSFFDPRAIPQGDYEAIAERVRGFERVIVECHPALVNAEKLRGWDRLEVAMGLETVHPDILARLNKSMTLDDFARAAATLRECGAALRVFVLVKPPFLDEAEVAEWAVRSAEFAFDCGATVVSLIPTRAGNGALEALGFVPPRPEMLEAALIECLRLGRGRVFADVWDAPPEQAARLREMNLRQVTDV